MSQNQRVAEYGREIAAEANKRAGAEAFTFDTKRARVEARGRVTTAGISFSVAHGVAGSATTVIVANYEDGSGRALRESSDGTLDTGRLARWLANEYTLGHIRAERARKADEATSEAELELERLLRGGEIFGNAYFVPTAVVRYGRALPAVSVGGAITIDELKYMIEAMQAHSERTSGAA